MRRPDVVVVDDDGACRLGLGDGVAPRERGHIIKRQRILDRQVREHPACRMRQRGDELRDYSGLPAVIVAGRLDVDPGQQVVAPQR